MTGIIANAQKLLDGATPGPWKINDEFDPDCPELQGAPRTDGGIIKVPVLIDSIYGHVSLEDAELIAAAPEMAQALAEEEYQYGVAYTGLKHGGQHIQWVESTGDTEWDKETLQLLIKRWKRQGQSPKIVRRRVSPPEVINE